MTSRRTFFCKTGRMKTEDMDENCSCLFTTAIGYRIRDRRRRIQHAPNGEFWDMSCDVTHFPSSSLGAVGCADGLVLTNAPDWPVRADIVNPGNL